MESDNQSTILSSDPDSGGTSNPTVERSRVYFDVQIGNRKEGRVTFELVRTPFKFVRIERFVVSSWIIQN